MRVLRKNPDRSTTMAQNSQGNACLTLGYMLWYNGEDEKAEIRKYCEDVDLESVSSDF